MCVTLAGLGGLDNSFPLAETHSIVSLLLYAYDTRCLSAERAVGNAREPSVAVMEMVVY